MPIRLLLIHALVALTLLTAICAKRVELSSTGPTLNFSLIRVSDFVVHWTSAHALRDGKLDLLFNQRAYSDYMDQLMGEHVEPHLWHYPPHILLLIAPFGYLAYLPAWLLWSVLGLAAFYATIRLAPQPLPTPLIALTLLSPASMVNLLAGQSGFFCALMLLGGLYLLPKKPLLAGLLFGLLTIKPHLGVLLVPALLILGQWRAIAAAIVTTATLIGASILAWGIAPWQAFIEAAPKVSVSLLERFDGFYTLMMPGLIAAQRVLGIPLATAWIVFAAIALPLAALILAMIRREGLTPRTTLAMMLGTLLVIPYGYNYDMPAIALALIVYLHQRQPLTSRESLLFQFIWAAPVLVYFLNLLALPLVPLALIGGILLLWREHRQTAA